MLTSNPNSLTLLLITLTFSLRNIGCEISIDSILGTWHGTCRSQGGYCPIEGYTCLPEGYEMRQVIERTYYRDNENTIWTTLSSNETKIVIDNVTYKLPSLNMRAKVNIVEEEILADHENTTHCYRSSLPNEYKLYEHGYFQLTNSDSTRECPNFDDPRVGCFYDDAVSYYFCSYDRESLPNNSSVQILDSTKMMYSILALLIVYLVYLI